MFPSIKLIHLNSECADMIVVNLCFWWSCESFVRLAWFVVSTI